MLKNLSAQPKNGKKLVGQSFSCNNHEVFHNRLEVQSALQTRESAFVSSTMSVNRREREDSRQAVKIVQVSLWTSFI